MDDDLPLEFTATLWAWEKRRDLWTFVSLPAELGGRGFGSVPVRVRVGTTTWRTSVFPQGDGIWVLPIKRVVRERHGLEVGGPVRVDLEPMI
jgi:hypothetical protein